MMDVKKQARKAGALYFLVLLIAPIGLMYVPGKLFVRGDPRATAEHIRNAEALLRIGISSELLHEVIWVFMVLTLYQLFTPVNKTHARQLLVFGALVSVPIVFINVVNEIAAMMLATGHQYVAAFIPEQLDALAFLFYRLHGQGINVASIFWGIWLLPFGMLVIRSAFIPKVFGVLLFPAGIGYVVSAFTTLLLPQYQDPLDKIARLLSFGELPIIFWLLIWGAKPSSSSANSPGLSSRSD